MVWAFSVLLFSCGFVVGAIVSAFLRGAREPADGEHYFRLWLQSTNICKRRERRIRELMDERDIFRRTLDKRDEELERCRRQAREVVS